MWSVCQSLCSWCNDDSVVSSRGSLWWSCEVGVVSLSAAEVDDRDAKLMVSICLWKLEVVSLSVKSMVVIV